MASFRNMAVIVCVCLAVAWAANSDTGASLVYGTCLLAVGCVLVWGAGTGKSGAFPSFLGRSPRAAVFLFGVILAGAGAAILLHRILELPN